MERSSEKITDDILVTKARNRNGELLTTVFYKYIPVVKFDAESNSERHIAVVELVEQGICDQTIAGKICGFHRNTVSKLKKLKAYFGIAALISDNRGLKQPLIYTDEVRQTIEQLLDDNPDWKDYQIANQAAIAQKRKISRSAVARIRVSRRWDDAADVSYNMDTMEELLQVARTIDLEHYNSDQLQLNLQYDADLKQTVAELENRPSIASPIKSEQDLITRLQRGELSPCAGSFMHNLFLQEINYYNLMSCLATNTGTTYQYQDILTTLYFKIANGIKSIEALKLINSSSMGVLIGKSRIPEKEVMRDRLTSLAEQYLSEHLIDDFARILLEQNRIDSEVFFIDGHFLPYYGLNVISKGYFTVRRLAMKGNELYVISDLQGRPLFFITENNDIDFRPIISQAVDKVIEYGIERPLFCFDRGGYGIRFFYELIEKADFVTWAKYLSDLYLNKIDAKHFSHGIAVGDKKYLMADVQYTAKESIQTAKKESRMKPIQLQLRLVVLEDIDTNKRMGILASNNVKTAGDIAYYMLNRWGDSENLYKKLMANFNLNYHPGYDIEALAEQPLVDNPDIAAIKEAIKILTKELATTQHDIDAICGRLSRRNDKRLIKKWEKLEQQLTEKQQEKINFSEKLKTLPDKVSIIEVLKGKPMSRCDLEKKKVYDLMQFMVLHSYERLEEIFKKCYKDQRDIKQVLKMITNKSGFIKLVGDTLIVVLEKIELKKYRQAAIALCRELNSMNITTGGPIKMKLFFYVSNC